MTFINRPMLKPGKIEEREYQTLLADRVLEKGNTLVVAPTALGKTIIAAIVSAERLKNDNSKIVFLAPTKPLAVQHLKSMKEFIDINETKFSLVTGAVAPSERKEKWEDARIICGTPQSFENDILTKSILLDDVSLLIIDEAHRAVKGYSYTFIAGQYMEKAKNPLILALTASPGSTREKIQEVCSNLHIKNIEVKRETDSDVRDFVNEKKIFWEKVQFPESYKEVHSLFKEFIREKLQELKEMGLIENYNANNFSKKQLLILNQRLLKMPFGNSFKGMSIVAMLMKINHATELLETQGIEPLKQFFKKLESDKSKAAKAILENIKIKKAQIQLEKIDEEHPKILKLIEVVKQELQNMDNIIVFSHFRNTGNYIEKILKQNGVKAQRFVGQATKENDPGMTQKKQIEILQKFRDKEFNVLVATSVAEEGLDLPDVDCVIFYEPVPSEIRFIQRRGRTGRHHEGKIIILMTQGTRDEAYFWVSKSKEKRMHSVLQEMNDIIETKKQKTLGDFGTEFAKDEDPETVLIFADNRERASGVTRELMKMNANIKPTQLLVGDFLISDRIVIERKSGDDFINSIIDGRLFSQLGHLVSNFQKPIIIIEGEIYGIRNIPDNALRGAISSLIVDYGIPIIQTKDTEDTAKMIYFLARREQLDLKKDVKLRGYKRGMPDFEQQQFIIESLPTIGPSLAKNLLKHFKTVKNIVNAGEKELKEVELMGDKKAKAVTDIVNKEYSVD